MLVPGSRYRGVRLVPLAIRSLARRDDKCPSTIASKKCAKANFRLAATWPPFVSPPLWHFSSPVQVPRVQYGTSGIRQQPRGLLLETFLKHAHPGVFDGNRYPKVGDRGFKKRKKHRAVVKCVLRYSYRVPRRRKLVLWRSCKPGVDE